VPDQKPPRLEGDERATVRALLQYQRESLVRKVTGVDEAAARHTLVDSGTTLLWLTKHMAHAESLWIQRRFAGLEIPPVLDGDGFSLATDDTIASLCHAYQEAAARTDEIASAAAGPDAPLALGTHGLTLRWALAHVTEETARHAGHADILRELLDGATGR